MMRDVATELAGIEAALRKQGRDADADDIAKLLSDLAEYSTQLREEMADLRTTNEAVAKRLRVRDQQEQETEALSKCCAELDNLQPEMACRVSGYLYLRFAPVAERQKQIRKAGPNTRPKGVRTATPRTNP